MLSEKRILEKMAIIPFVFLFLAELGLEYKIAILAAFSIVFYGVRILFLIESKL